MKKVYFGLIIISIILIGFVSADFTKGSKLYNIEDKYASGSDIIGWINISLKNESAGSLLETNYGKSIKILDFLEINEADYTCNPEDCSSDFSSSNPTNSKTFTLDNEEKYIGLKFRGNIEFIDSVSFKVESNAESSCSNQLKIDFFGDNVTDFGNTKSSISLCPNLKRYGCFDLTDQNEENVISETPYCQRITIPESPGIRVGAWIKKINGNRNITMTIYDETEEIENVNCKISGVTSNGEENYCDVNYSFLESKEYYVCLYSNEGIGESVIRQNVNNKNVCGFNNYPLETEEAAYQIFVIPKKFDSVGLINVSEILQNDESLSVNVEEYLRDKYDGLDCTNDCVVPIKIISKLPQTVTLKDLELKYKKTSGSVIERNFYDTNKTDAKINSDFQQLFFEGSNLTVPTSTGNKELKLSLNGKEIFSEDINIANAAKINSLFPTMTAAAYPTLFTANLSYNRNYNATDYVWMFGDGSQETTKTNKVTHSYNTTGNYSLKLTIKSKDYEVSKSFNIQVGSPKSLVNSSLSKKLSDITKLKTQLNTFSQFEKERISSIIDINTAEQELKSIQTDYASAYSESDYIKIMNELLQVKVPISVQKSLTMSSIPFYPKKEDIDLSIVELVGSGTYGGESSDFSDAVLEWNTENIESTISFSKITLKFSSDDQTDIKFFDVKVKENSELNYDTYFVLEDLEDLSFKSDYSGKEESGYQIIRISESEKTISFSTTDDVDFQNLPAFISPSVGKLPVYVEPIICNNNNICEESDGETTTNCNDCKSYLKWYLAGLIIGIAIILYILLHIWYIRKYENYLFGRRNNVFNIVTYINNLKKQGANKSQITSNLKKAGWSLEQISYALKKSRGIIIGMPGLSTMIKLPQRSSTQNNPQYRKV